MPPPHTAISIPGVYILSNPQNQALISAEYYSPILRLTFFGYPPSLLFPFLLQGISQNEIVCVHFRDMIPAEPHNPSVDRLKYKLSAHPFGYQYHEVQNPFPESQRMCFPLIPSIPLFRNPVIIYISSAILVHVILSAFFPLKIPNRTPCRHAQISTPLQWSISCWMICAVKPV